MHLRTVQIRYNSLPNLQPKWLCCHKWDQIWILERTFSKSDTPGRPERVLQLFQQGNVSLSLLCRFSACQSHCPTCPYMVAYSLTDPLNFLIFCTCLRIWPYMVRYADGNADERTFLSINPPPGIYSKITFVTSFVWHDTRHFIYQWSTYLWEED